MIPSAADLVGRNERSSNREATAEAEDDRVVVREVSLGTVMAVVARNANRTKRSVPPAAFPPPCHSNQQRADQSTVEIAIAHSGLRLKVSYSIETDTPARSDSWRHYGLRLVGYSANKNGAFRWRKAVEPRFLVGQEKRKPSHVRRQNTRLHRLQP